MDLVLKLEKKLEASDAALIKSKASAKDLKEFNSKLTGDVSKLKKDLVTCTKNRKQLEGYIKVIEEIEVPELNWVQSFFNWF